MIVLRGLTKHSTRLLRGVPYTGVSALRTFATKSACGNSLKRIFDDQKYFDDFNRASGRPLKDGLFGNKMLLSPEGMIKFSKHSLAEAKSLVSGMLTEFDTNDQGKFSYIRKLDQLSDLLCRVIDVAEFIRVVHPDALWVEAAQDTHEIMFEYMNELNTNVELYQKLKDALEDKTVLSKLTDEEVQVGEYLKLDFERSGIHMTPEIRRNFVALTQQISLLGSTFNNGIHELQSLSCEISLKEFETLHGRLQREIKSYLSSLPKPKPNMISVPLVDHIPYSILASCPSEDTRRKIWIAIHNSTPEQLQILNQIVQYRAILAKMLGFQSFSHYQLDQKMAKNPENVITFLRNLQDSLQKSQLLDEVKNLYDFKPGANLKLSGDAIYNEVKPWDRDFLLHRYQSQKLDETPIKDISEYFSVGTMMSGLSKLFESLYNVTFIPEPTSQNESWDQDQVRKLCVFDLNSNKKLGYLYVDFWSPKVLPSHFTIVCLRRLNTDLNYETTEKMKNLVHLNEDENYQLPVISLICNFPKGSKMSLSNIIGKGRPTLLNLDQVETIFHEMGHAMHSMIGKTDLHNLSGTRCMTDFVELPSVLMEYFCKDPRVLCEIATHYETGEPLPIQLLQAHQNRRKGLDQSETFMQSKMAMLDQALHGEKVINLMAENPTAFDTTPIYHNLESKLKVFSDPVSTWHAKFPHLFSYGAVYYSYLLDRAIASKVWSYLFEKDPWSSVAGSKYRENLLKWGGTKDPWACLADTLDEKELNDGGNRAMEIIANDNIV